MKVFVAINIFCALLSTCSAHQYLNPEWVEPHAWAGEKDPLQKLCPQQIDCKQSDKQYENNLNALVAFKKLVYNLFDRNKFKLDESSNYLYRTVHIHATDEQLQKLFKFSDADDLDGIVAEILSQSNFGTFQLIKELTNDVTTVVWNRMPSFSLDVPPRTKEITINFMLLVFAYIACRRFKINFAIVIVFALGYFLYEYLDYECHQRIAVEDTVAFIYGKDKNPCLSTSKTGWFGFLFGRDGKSECRDFLARQNRQTKKCGMVDLFHEFTSNILFKQISIFFKSLAELIQSISATYGIIITIITLFFMKDLLKVVIYSVFKFILNPHIWSRVANESTMPQNTQRQSIESDIKDVNLGKALDLANSKIQLILTETAITQAIQTHLETSRVQLLPIKNNATSSNERKRKLSASDTSPSSSKNSSNNATTESDSFDEINEVEFILYSSSSKENLDNNDCDFVDLALPTNDKSKSSASLNDDILILTDSKSSASSSSSCSKLPNDIDMVQSDGIASPTSER